MRKGDILSMKVEKVDESYVYATDNLNRLKIPNKFVDHIVYVNKKNFEEIKSNLSLSIQSLVGKKNWQISHFTESHIYIWNKKTKKIKKVLLEKEDSQIKERLQVEQRFSGLWGVFIGTNFLNPDVTTREKLNNSFQFQFELSNKIEYKLGPFSYFYSLHIAFGRLEKPILNQGLDTIDLVASFNWSLMTTDYIRFYLGTGLGSVFLRTFKEPASSAAEVTLALDLKIGMEFFILPYVSIKSSFGYTLYSQSIGIASFGFYSTRAIIGYYFF